AFAGSEDFRRRSLRVTGSGTANRGPFALDLRGTRACRNCRPRTPDSYHECVAIFPAARPGALDFIAVLDGPQHGSEELSVGNLQTISAHGHSRSLRFLSRVSALR